MAAELIALDGALKGVVLSLDKGEEWVLGRDPESCHLVIEDPKVERKACIIRLRDGIYTIESLTDTPIEVDGKEVKEAPLEEGTKVRFGETHFEFRLEGEPGVATFSSGEEEFTADTEIDLTHLPGEGDASEEFEEEPPPPPPEEMRDEGQESSAALDREPSEEMADEGEEEPSTEESPLPEEELVNEGEERREPSTEESEEVLTAEGQESEEGWEEEAEPDWEEEALSEEPAVAPPPPVSEPTEELASEGMEDANPPKPEEEFVSEQLAEEEQEEEPLFSTEGEEGEGVVDLTPSIRFLLKVIAGPNTGAEFALDLGREYLIGTDANSCDIVFHDLSVSREHARLYLSEEGELAVEDLGSRNGVLIDQEQVTGRVPLKPNLVVTLGTSAFFVVDREAPQETIVAPAFEAPRPPEQVEPDVEEEEETSEEEVVEAAQEEKPPVEGKRPGMGILVAIIGGLALLLAIGMLSLLRTTELKAPPKNYMTEIREAVEDFPGVKYTYSPTNHKLFLVGHVATGVEKNELLYNLNALTFLQGVEDHVVNDEAVWQEMNILLSKQPAFKGVSMHSPRPALFILSGYLKNEKQAADLTDWINLHFNYLNLLENHVVVEELMIDEISTRLLHSGFGAVAVSFSSGEVTLAGYVGSSQAYDFERVVHDIRQLPGVRQVQNFVVIVAPEEQVIDLNQRYPGRYTVTGFSKHGDVSINVVVNGRILSRGDTLDHMTLTSIQPHAIFFEKDGLKYKLEYNK